jgi:ferredoxin
MSQPRLCAKTERGPALLYHHAMDSTSHHFRFHGYLEGNDVGFDIPSDLPVLLAAEHAGLSLLSSCRNGTCRACLCQLRSGSVSYRIAWPGLSPDEKADGYILPCVAYATGDLVIADPFA